MARRWPISTRAWTCGQTSEAGGQDEGHSIRQIHRAPQLRRAGRSSSAGTPGAGQLGANPVNFAIRTTGILSLIFLILTLVVTPASRITRMELAGPVPPDAWAVRVLSRLPALLNLLRVRPRGERRAAPLSEIIKRPYLMVGTLGLVLMVPLAATSTDGMIRRLGGKGGRRCTGWRTSSRSRAWSTSTCS